MGITSLQYLSESSFILGVGLSTTTWHGMMGWAEAGSAISYVKGHMLPDYRGGVSMSRNFGKSLIAKTPGWFAASNTGGVFISRFGNDFLMYEQMRVGYTTGPNLLRAQIYGNLNVTLDARRQGWANFAETGPGIRFRAAMMPPSMFLTVDFMRG